MCSRTLRGLCLFVCLPSRSTRAQMTKAFFPPSNYLRLATTAYLLSGRAVELKCVLLHGMCSCGCRYVNRCNAKWAEAASWDAPPVYSTQRFAVEAGAGTAGVFKSEVAKLFQGGKLAIQVMPDG